MAVDQGVAGPPNQGAAGDSAQEAAGGPDAAQDRKEYEQVLDSVVTSVSDLLLPARPGRQRRPGPCAGRPVHGHPVRRRTDGGPERHGPRRPPRRHPVDGHRVRRALASTCRPARWCWPSSRDRTGVAPSTPTSWATGSPRPCSAPCRSPCPPCTRPGPPPAGSSRRSRWTSTSKPCPSRRDTTGTRRTHCCVPRGRASTTSPAATCCPSSATRGRRTPFPSSTRARTSRPASAALSRSSPCTAGRTTAGSRRTSATRGRCPGTTRAACGSGGSGRSC